MAAGVGAFALAMVGMGIASTAANAAVGPDQPGAPTTGTLTINKYGGLPVDQGGNLENTLDGVEFTVTQVGQSREGTCTALSLTNAAQWAGLESLFNSAPAAPKDPFCLTTEKDVAATDEAGSAEFALPVGVYFVEETDPGANPIVSEVPNFYVSIPTSNGAKADGWNYDVVMHPKNQLMNEPTKTIEESPAALAIGSEVAWTLKIPIPVLADGETFDSGSVTDELDTRMSYASSKVSIGNEQLKVGTDYTVDEGGVTWTFTPAVLDANQGETIVIELVTTVDEVGDGQIANKGGDGGNYSSEFNGATVPGGTSPETYWGQLAIVKTDDSTPAQMLEGAEFKVFNTAADGTCAADAPAAGEIATGTSDENGVVQWEKVKPTDTLGLWIANVNNGPADPAPTKNYCVYETVTPVGHTATPIANPVTIEHGVDAVTEFTVVNPKKDGPDLPLTGAQGTLAMTIGGLALTAIGATAIVLAHRRRMTTNS